jgi:hypothetical protein
MRTNFSEWSGGWRGPALIEFLVRVLIVVAIFALVFLA